MFSIENWSCAWCSTVLNSFIQQCNKVIDNCIRECECTLCVCMTLHIDKVVANVLNRLGLVGALHFNLNVLKLRWILSLFSGTIYGDLLCGCEMVQVIEYDCNYNTIEK